MNIELKFQTKHSGFKLLKTEYLPTLAPISLIEKCSLNSVQINHDIPIFFNIQNENFVIFFADDFLNDYKENEIFSKKTGGNPFVYENKEKQKFLGFSYKSLKELRDDFINKESKFFLFKEYYESHLLDIKKGEHVIVLCFKNAPSNECFKDINFNLKDISSIMGSSSKFEFFQAFKFNNTYYLLDKNNQLDQTRSFKLDKNSPQSMNYLVIPFNEKDWDMANEIYQKIINIKNTIDLIFFQQKQPGLLDKSFDENLNPLLENKQGGKSLKR